MSDVFLEDVLNQTAVYWAPGSVEYDEYGAPQYASPVELDCRWDDVTEEFVGATGEREFSRAKVMLDQDVAVRGVLFLGDLTDLDDADVPLNNDGAAEIRRFDKTPSFDADEFVRVAFL